MNKYRVYYWCDSFRMHEDFTSYQEAYDFETEWFINGWETALVTL